MERSDQFRILKLDGRLSLNFHDPAVRGWGRIAPAAMVISHCLKKPPSNLSSGRCRRTANSFLRLSRKRRKQGRRHPRVGVLFKCLGDLQ